MTEKNRILGMDIGGTTFSSVLYDKNLKPVHRSKKHLINKYDTTESLVEGISRQVRQLLAETHTPVSQVVGLGIACPGPLDAKTGTILETPNLKLLQNFPIADALSRQLAIPVKIENDANLFALGEWHNLGSKADVLIGVTLGTGLGFGIVIDGRMFTGAHGMAAEYGISPMDGRQWEDGIAIRGLTSLSKEYFAKNHSPMELNYMAREGSRKALEIWKLYGERVGLFLSHAVNMLDPQVITIGGGISHAFRYFETAMNRTIEKYSPAFRHYPIRIMESDAKEYSAMSGAAMLINNG